MLHCAFLVKIYGPVWAACRVQDLWSCNITWIYSHVSGCKHRMVFIKGSFFYSERSSEGCRHFAVLKDICAA